MIMRKMLDTEQMVADLDALLQHTLSKVASGKLSVDRAHNGLIELILLIDNREPTTKDWLEQSVEYLVTNQ